MARARIFLRSIISLAVCLAVLIPTLSVLNAETHVSSASRELFPQGGPPSPPDPQLLTPPLTLPLASPLAQTDGDFGSSIAINDTTVVIGAPDETASAHSDAGHAYVFNSSTGGLIATLTSPNAQSFGEFGSSVAISGTMAVVGAPNETASGFSNAGRAYVFRTSNGALISTLTSPNAQAGGGFGSSVAISGTTVVVGAPTETSSGYSGAGNAYVFKASTGALISTLTSPSAQAGGGFGISVGISGTRVVVGASGESSRGVTDAGNAYIFRASNGALTATVPSQYAQTYGLFGWSVAISSTRVVVGAPGQTALGYSGAGNTYVFHLTGALISQLYSPNVQTYGDFGWSVGIYGKETVVVGARNEAASGYGDAGHAYVFQAATAVSATAVSTLVSPNAQSDAFFGNSVATNGTAVVVGAPYETALELVAAGHAYISDALNGAVQFGSSVAINGTTVVVGAPDETVSGYAEAGQAYVFNATTGTLLLTLTSPTPQAGGWFGASVATNGTVVVVGAPLEGACGSKQAGQVYTFNAMTGALLLTLTSPHCQAYGEFGISVAISGSMLAVGAGGEAAAGLGAAGRAYVFNAATGALLHKLISPNAQAAGSFGFSVAISGDTVVVGAPYEMVSGDTDAGEAYVFTTRGALLSTLSSPNVHETGSFGWSVSVSGTDVVVGAPGELVSGNVAAGRAYVWSTTGAPISTLISPSPQAGGSFGDSVAIDGTTVVVGAAYETASGFSEAGNTYVYNAAGGAPTYVLPDQYAQSMGLFGNSVAISGTTVVVGAPDEMGSGYAVAGEAYIFALT